MNNHHLVPSVSRWLLSMGSLLSELQDCLAIELADLNARMLEGNLFAERRDTEHAAAVFRDVLRRKPKSAEAHNNLGLVWLDEGKIDLARLEKL